MGDWSKIKQQVLESLNKAQNTTIEPGDEQRYNDSSNLTNMGVEYFGLPNEWKTNLADEKRALAELPMQMGMGTMGQLRNVGTASKIAKSAAQKLAEVPASPFGKVVVADEAAQGLGKVKVQDIPGETFKGNNQWGGTKVMDMFNKSPLKKP